KDLAPPLGQHRDRMLDRVPLLPSFHQLERGRNPLSPLELRTDALTGSTPGPDRTPLVELDVPGQTIQVRPAGTGRPPTDTLLPDQDEDLLRHILSGIQVPVQYPARIRRDGRPVGLEQGLERFGFASERSFH